jgi:hypothetical protein
MRLLGIRSAVLTSLLVCAALAATILGCLPTRGDVSPDGRTFYFSMMVPTEKENTAGSAVLALDAETGRVRALTDSVGGGFWCCLSPDGKYLTYMGPDGGVVSFMDLDKGIATPLTGALDGYGYPRLIQAGEDEKALGVLVKTLRGNEDKAGGHWVVLAQGGAVPVPDLEGYGASLGEPAVIAGGTLVLPVYKVLSSDEADKNLPKKYESAVIVLDVSEPLKVTKDDAAKPAAPPAPPKATVLAKWTSEGSAPPTIDVAITSKDSKADRMVAAVSGQGADKETTQFFELFPLKKDAPKLLFEAAKAGSPQWTPDGQAIVYLRANAANNTWNDLVLWRPEQKEPLVLAHMQGKTSDYDDPIVAWRWLANGRLRVFNVSRDGLRQVDTAADGTGAKARFLRSDRLDLQAALTLAYQARHAAPPFDKLPLDQLEEKAKPSLEAAAAAVKALDAAYEKLWLVAAEWEDVPALPDVPPPPPKPAAAPPETVTPPAPTGATAKPAPRPAP